MRALLTTCAIFALAACGQTTATTETQAEPVAETPAAPMTAAEATAQDTCGASQYQALIGTNIAAATYPADANIRVIRPNEPVTQDFSAQRLNIVTDAAGLITSLECY